MTKQFSLSLRVAAAAIAASLVHVGAARADQPAPVSAGPTNAELEAQIQALQEELQATQINQNKDSRDIANLPKPPTGWWNNTSISGRVYMDMTNIDHEANGVKSTTDNGVGFDIKRFYLGVDHKFTDRISANVTTDFQYNSTLGATELYIKKAYLQTKISDALTFRFGSADMPWIPFVEDVYGYRYLENTLIDRTKFGTSADWGIHALGKFQDGLINYQLSVVNGAGYKAAPGAGNATHFQTVDVEGRVNLNWKGFVVGLGGYSGKLGKDVENAVIHHTASRFDALAAYTTPKLRLGVEYFQTTDWNNVTTVAADKADGVGVFGSYQFEPKWGVFGRYDHVEPNQKTNANLDDNYYTFGISYSPAKIVDFSLAYKHERAEDGSLATSNGTIGGSKDGTYDEVGIWSQFRW